MENKTEQRVNYLHYGFYFFNFLLLKFFFWNVWQSSSDAIEIDSFFLPPQKALDLRKTNVVLLQFLRKIRQIIFSERRDWRAKTRTLEERTCQ